MVRVSDGVVDTDVTITITVTEVNDAPVLAGVPSSATINEGEAYTFTAAATDADDPAQTLTFSLVDAPAGASIDASTGVFTWTPSEAQGGSDYRFMVRVSDGVVDPDLYTTIFRSEVNDAPVLAGVPSSVSINEGEAYTFTAAATDADDPAQTLTFSLVGAPEGASIDANGVFTWTPSEAQGGSDYSFMVRVSDGVVDTDVTITITVTEVNDTAGPSGRPVSGI